MTAFAFNSRSYGGSAGTAIGESVSTFSSELLVCGCLRLSKCSGSSDNCKGGDTAPRAKIVSTKSLAHATEQKITSCRPKQNNHS